MHDKFDLYARRLPRPKTWSIAARRAFVLTLPVSVPVWLLAMAGIVVGKVSLGAVRPLASFWNAPPEKLPRSRYYSYLASDSKKVVPLEAARDRQADRITGT